MFMRPKVSSPRQNERYNLVIIGSGPAGLTCAMAAVKLGAKVALIEKGPTGGDCLNVGCVPSKALIRPARLRAEILNAAHFGLGKVSTTDDDTNFIAAMTRMRRLRTRIGKKDSAERYQDLGVDFFQGFARFSGPRTISVEGKTLHFAKAVIATGARPVEPCIPGIVEAGYFTNETIFDLTKQPKRLGVIGGGPLGCEMAQAFRRLGSEVWMIHHTSLFLPKEERDAAQILSDSFAADGIHIHLNTDVERVTTEGNEKIIHFRSGSTRSSVRVDAIITGIGRTPNIEGLDLEKAGIAWESKKGIKVNDFLQTTNPRVYAAGDACLHEKFTHAADAAARIVIRNALFLGRARQSDLVIPWCTYTDPEIAHVGVYVRHANTKGLSIKTITVLLSDVDRAVLDGEDRGFVKIHIREGTDQIVGATVVASHAGEMINEISLAMMHGIGLKDLAKVIHAYPTQAAAIKIAADTYNATRVTPFLHRLSQSWLGMSRR